MRSNATSAGEFWTVIMWWYNSVCFRNLSTSFYVIEWKNENQDSYCSCHASASGTLECDDTVTHFTDVTDGNPSPVLTTSRSCRHWHSQATHHLTLFFYIQNNTSESYTHSPETRRLKFTKKYKSKRNFRKIQTLLLSTSTVVAPCSRTCCAGSALGTGQLYNKFDSSSGRSFCNLFFLQAPLGRRDQFGKIITRMTR